MIVKVRVDFVLDICDDFEKRINIGTFRGGHWSFEVKFVKISACLIQGDSSHFVSATSFQPIIQRVNIPSGPLTLTLPSPYVGMGGSLTVTVA